MDNLKYYQKLGEKAAQNDKYDVDTQPGYAYYIRQRSTGQIMQDAAELKLEDAIKTAEKFRKMDTLG